MKSIFKLLTVVLISVLLASCGAGVDGVDGSSSTAGLVGQWKADLSSFDLILGDGVPAEMVVSKKGDDKTEELDYNFDGNKLALSGEVEGDKVNINLNISEVTADKFTIALTGEEVLAQIKAEYPELLASAGEVDVDAMVKGCSVTLSFKK
jgi:hypothetical protein